jgi:hypothetical protein
MDTMLGHKKDHRGQTTGVASGYAGRPGQEESMRVLAAFLARPAPGAGASGPGSAAGEPGPVIGAGPSGSTGAGTPGPPPPLAVTGWTGAGPPPASGLNIRPLIGAENSYRNLPPGGQAKALPIPGVGPVSSDRFQQVYAQVNDLVTRLSGGADLSQRWTPDQVQTALAGLEVEHSQTRLTEEQYQALKAALESMLVQ